MNKQELQTMIDSTIVPNKKKGITAESLRLVLKEMASATNEGGGSDVEVLSIWGGDFNELYEFNYDTVEQLITGLQNDYPTLKIRDGHLHNYYLNALKNNAETYQRLLENKGKKDIICVFCSGQEQMCSIKDIYNPLCDELYGFKLYDEEESFVYTQVPLIYAVYDQKYTDEGKSNLGVADMTDTFFYLNMGEESSTIFLHPDGSLSWEFEEQEEASASNGDIVFVCTQRIDEELTPEQKNHNIEMLNRIKNAEIKPHASLAIPHTYDFGTFTTNSIAWETTYMSDPELGDVVYMAVFIGGAFQGVIVYSDGTVEIFTE